MKSCTCLSLPEGRASITYPVTGAAPISPSVQWIASAEDVLVMDISIGDPGEPVVTDTYSFLSLESRAEKIIKILSKSLELQSFDQDKMCHNMPLWVKHCGATEGTCLFSTDPRNNQINIFIFFSVKMKCKTIPTKIGTHNAISVKLMTIWFFAYHSAALRRTLHWCTFDSHPNLFLHHWLVC